MTAASDLITDALNELGVYAAGETVSAADLSQGLAVLNRMIDAWAEERLTVTQLVPITPISLVIGVPVVSVQVPSFRPVGWVYGPGQGSVTISGTTTALNVVSSVEFAAIAGSPGSGTPTMVWPDVSQFPFQNLNFAPTPNAAGTATVNQLTPITSFASTSTAYTLGTGVQDALTHNLAIALKPYFSTAQLAPEIMVLAQETKNFLRYTNRSSRALLGRDRKAVLPKPSAPGEQ